MHLFVVANIPLIYRYFWLLTNGRIVQATPNLTLPMWFINSDTQTQRKRNFEQNNMNFMFLILQLNRNMQILLLDRAPHFRLAFLSWPHWRLKLCAMSDYVKSRRKVVTRMTRDNHFSTIIAHTQIVTYQLNIIFYFFFLWKSSCCGCHNTLCSNVIG